MAKYQNVRGMRDLFETDLALFERVEKKVSKIAQFYNFSKIQTPLVEDAEIFEKGTGQATDIVEKEMYSFRSKGGDRLALRPEFTPGLVRAYIQHGLASQSKPVNLWTLGPLFRYERPQAGRYRQFHQFNFESFGVKEPVVDVMTVEIIYQILKEIGFRNLMVEVNSIGDSQCRPYFKKTLTSYLRSHQSSLCADCKNRLKKNPLRALDCKEEKCQRIKKSAPQILDHLCKECHHHFKLFLEFLDELEIPYVLNPYLVRGLDYYTRTVFEIYEDTPEGRQQGALAGGGRYDDLVKLLGGKDTPACGGAAGLERLVNLLQAKPRKTEPAPQADVFLAQVGDLAKKKGLKLLEDFRSANLPLANAIHKDSLSSQLKSADRLKAKYVLILGQQEALGNKLIIREMKTGRQRTIDLSKAVSEVKKKTAAKRSS